MEEKKKGVVLKNASVRFAENTVGGREDIHHW